MTLFLLLLALAVVGVVAAVATGRVRGGLDEPVTTRPYRPLPESRFTSEDVDAVRFTLGFRGYRMDEVDTVLARLGDALTERDHEIRELKRSLPADPETQEEAGPRDVRTRDADTRTDSSQDGEAAVG